MANSIEIARGYRLDLKDSLQKRGFTVDQSQFLTGISIANNYASRLIPYGIIDPGRMDSEQFHELLTQFPDLQKDYQEYLRNAGTLHKFAMASTLTELVEVPPGERELVWKIAFERRFMQWEIE